MNRNSAASMYGGAGGRGARASVSSPQGLRNALRPEAQRQQPQNFSPAPAPAPADDKRTMEGLNTRLSEYVGRMKQLERVNKEQEDKIEEILKNRDKATDRIWDEIMKPLSDLRKEINDITMENAKLLQEIEQNNMTNKDYQNKLDAEQFTCQNIAQELADLRQQIDDSQLESMNIESQIENDKEELAYMKKDHDEEVAVLKKKIKDSDVIVEVDAAESKLGETIDKIRKEYEKIISKNNEEASKWYRNKFENIKVEDKKNAESLEVCKTELNELRRTKQQREIDVQTLIKLNQTLEETLIGLQGGCRLQLAHENQKIQQLKDNLTQIRAQMERQAEDHEHLLTTKMALEAEIQSYRELMTEIENSHMNLNLEDGLQNGGSPENQSNNPENV